MKGRALRLLLVFLLIFSFGAHAQKAKKKEPVTHEKEVRDMVSFLQYMLNTLGDASTSAADKDIMVTESFTKIFRDGKVQIEDDLVENRNVITNKDVQAYLKDVDFFFKDVKFDLHIDDIKSEGSEKDKLFYKVTVSRNLKGTTIEGKSINKTMPRYIEINYDTRQKELKIVSIYTKGFDQKGALLTWWKGLSFEWEYVFKKSLKMKDSVSLEDIMAVTAIDTLDISNNIYLQNLEPLAQLLDLKVLKLAKTKITDLTPIRNLTGLVELDFSNTTIRDIRALHYSSSLEKLNMSSTAVDSIEVLEKLTNLKVLQLRKTKVNDFSALQYLTQLQQLDLEGTPINNLAPLEPLTMLTELNLSHTFANDLKSLTPLTNITLLSVDSTGIKDLNPLAGMTKLQVLHANRTGITTLDPLLKLPQLEKVYCDHTAIKQPMANAFMTAKPQVLVISDSEDMKGWWSGLSSAWKDVISRSAHISMNPTKEELAGITGLDSINFAKSISIRDLTPIKRLPKLQVILANRTAVADLSLLKEVKNLRFLDISNTQVTDVSALCQLTQLATLVADNNKIENFDTLANIASLKKLYVDDNGIDDAQVQKFLAKNPSCLVVYKTGKLQDWWNGLPEAWQQVFEKQFVPDNKPNRNNLHRLIENEKLAFRDVNATDLQALAPFIRLKDLRFSATAISDLSAIGALTAIETLYINDNPIRNVEPLGALKNLQDLDISNTPVAEVEVLQSLNNLKKLNCAGTQIKKLNALKEIKSLEYLDCSNTDVKSLDPVMNLSLKNLKCYNANISEKQIAKFKKNNPDCTVVYYR